MKNISITDSVWLSSVLLGCTGSIAISRTQPNCIKCDLIAFNLIAVRKSDERQLYINLMSCYPITPRKINMDMYTRKQVLLSAINYSFINQTATYKHTTKVNPGDLFYKHTTKVNPGDLFTC